MCMAQEAVKARLTAAIALREACEGRACSATEMRREFMFDPFKPAPADIADLARKLDAPWLGPEAEKLFADVPEILGGGKP